MAGHYGGGEWHLNTGGGEWHLNTGGGEWHLNTCSFNHGRISLYIYEVTATYHIAC